MSVEFAAVLPLLAVAMLLVAQVGLLVAEQLAVQHAAREAARAAAVSGNDAAARDTAIASGNLAEDRTTVDIAPSERTAGTLVRATVRYRATLIPGLGAFTPDAFTLEGSAAMRAERGAP